MYSVDVQHMLSECVVHFRVNCLLSNLNIKLLIRCIWCNKLYYLNIFYKLNKLNNILKCLNKRWVFIHINLNISVFCYKYTFI